jgi:diguanylate cyclase (GGDEF)-like protein/PAS domain S-box-containing protein
MVSSNSSQTTRGWVIETAGLTVLYLLAALGGLWLYIPPDGLALIWLPAGLAVAAFALLGFRAAAGIWLGAFLGNLYGLLTWDNLPLMLVLFVSAMIALASMLQALIIVLLVRQERSLDWGFTIRTLLRIAIIVAGATLLSATVRWLLLLAFSRLPADIGTSWWLWWLGDALGVIVCTPLFLAIGLRLQRSAIGHLLVPVVASLGLGLSLLLFGVVWSLETNQLIADLETANRARVGRIQSLIDSELEQIIDTANLYIASDEVTRAEFVAFTSHERADAAVRSASRRLYWVPPVTGAERSAFEQAAVADGLRDFRFLAMGTDQRWAPAPERPEYLPLYFGSASDSEGMPLGYDLGSNRVLRSILTCARDSADFCSARIGTTPPFEAGRSHLFVAYPIYTPGALPADVPARRERIASYIVGTFDLQQILTVAFNADPAAALEYMLYTRSAPIYAERVGGGIDLQMAADAVQPPGRLVHESSFYIAGQNWRLAAHTTPEFVWAHRSGMAWMLLGSGLICTGLLCVFLEHRRRATSLLRDSREHYRLLAENVSDVITVYDLTSGTIRYISPSIENLLGYTPQEALGAGFESLVEANSLHHGMANFGGHRARFLAGAASEYTDQYRLRRRDGALVWVEVTNRFVRDVRTGTLEIYSVIRDISKRKLAEEVLEIYRLIVSASRDLLFYLDRDLVYRAVNDAYLRAYGLRREDVIGRRIPEIVGPTIFAQIESLITRALQGETQHVSTWFTYPATGRRFGDVTVIPHRDQDGNIIGLFGSIHDSTERKDYEQNLAENAERLRQVTDTLPQVAWLAEWNGQPQLGFAGLKMLYVSPMFETITGYPPEPLAQVGAIWLNAIHPDDRERLAGLYAQLETTGFECEYRLIRADGTVRHIHDRVTPIYNQEGRVYRVAGLTQDITERKLAEGRLRQAAAVFENTLEGVVITDPDGTIISVNQAFTEITGYSVDEAVGRNPRIKRSDRHDTEFYKQMWQAVIQDGRWQGEVWNQRKDGEVYPEWLTISEVRDDDGELISYIGVFSDISTLKQSQEQLARLAHYDTLTGLPNRLLMHTRLEHALARSRRNQTRTAVLFFDLDRFKNVNDSFGHPFGDELLVAISRRLRRNMREQDTLARQGGDEFVVVIEDVAHTEDVALVAQKIVQLLEQPFRLSNDQEVFIGCSIGISIGPDDGDDVIRLIRNADTAMYQAKNAGGNVYRFYTPTMTAAVNSRLNLEVQLRHALDRREFVLYYQPQVALADGRILGVEALIRWNHPELGFVAPGDFIPIAEETGLIVPIGEWVLREACRQGQVWRAQGLSDLTIAVNLSPIQFRLKDLVARIALDLENSGLSAAGLELEITESAFMADPEQAVATIQALKRLGVRVTIDDFGTGYSSLSYLQRFDIDRLKIDRSFIDDLPDKDGDAAIAAAIIAMARHLNLEVVAEGIERGEQNDWLQAEGCRLGQGYYFGHPEPAEALTQRLIGQFSTF